MAVGRRQGLGRRHGNGRELEFAGTGSEDGDKVAAAQYYCADTTVRGTPVTVVKPPPLAPNAADFFLGRMLARLLSAPRSCGRWKSGRETEPSSLEPRDFKNYNPRPDLPIATECRHRLHLARARAATAQGQVTGHPARLRPLPQNRSSKIMIKIRRSSKALTLQTMWGSQYKSRSPLDNGDPRRGLSGHKR